MWRHINTGNRVQMSTSIALCSLVSVLCPGLKESRLVTSFFIALLLRGYDLGFCGLPTLTGLCPITSIKCVYLWRAASIPKESKKLWKMWMHASFGLYDWSVITEFSKKKLLFFALNLFFDILVD